MKRRSFLKSGPVAAGALGLAALPKVEAQEAPLAPSLASLASMRHLAKPITAAERRGRIEKARRLMADQKIDAVLLTGGTSLVYFSGIQWGLSERLFAMILPVKGEPFFVSPAFEEDRAREQIAAGPVGGNADVRTWEEHESPYARVAQGLGDRGIASGRIGVRKPSGTSSATVWRRPPPR